MKAVNVVQRQHVDEAADRVRRHEVARHIQVSTTVSKARFVSHLDRGNVNARGLTHRQSLAQRLASIEHTGSRCTVEQNNVAVHANVVSLRVFILQSRTHANALTLQRFGSSEQLQPRSLLDKSRQIFGIALHSLVALGVGNERTRIEFETAGLSIFNLFRQRNHMKVGMLCPC